MSESESLGGASGITLLDQTRHYFGGYFHVKIHAYRDISLQRDFFATDAEYQDATGMLGTLVRFERVLEKMAVPQSEIESVCSQLTKDFFDSTGVYLSAPDFDARFVRSEYQKSVKKYGGLAIRAH
ncbi:MAG: hypothetical protein PHY09_13780 [Desulfuromonadaceae bacterium]|nr:hypothetical protein [Desulfuromonadaceae bacterium]MDD5105869.1 hypothetical protein [Desulfuromonadaceae bacterium]